MANFFKTLLWLAAWLGFLAAVGWAIRRVWQRSDDRPALLVRWRLTLADLAFIVFIVAPLFGEFGYVAAFAGVPLAAFAGLVMALIWVPSMVDAVGRRLGTLYDGGSTAPDPEPFFSIAEARRKQGRYEEALAAVREQLTRFPDHFRGQMLLAEIQAEDLRDLPAAATTIEACVSQPGHAPKNITFALLRLAEWQLKLASDRAAAQAALERIEQLLPGTPEAHLARQRLAHLTPETMLQEARERPKLEVPHAVERLGLLGETPKIVPRGSDPHERVERLVAQLDRFPEDNQTREELALLYREEFQRPDLAAEQLEQLIAQPQAPPAQIVRWLNLLADVHLDGAGDFEAARRALQRVVDLDPDSPAAAQARRRLALLPRQMAAKKQSQVLKLGSADPRMGLKGGPPQRA
jgi:tetratricopeptide (TPR) repeat protein